MPLPKAQNELAKKKKVEKNEKAPEVNTDRYVMKLHKRAKVTAFAIYDREQKKQIGQLTNSVIADADQKVAELVKQINNGQLSETELVQCLNRIKSGSE